MKYKGWTLRNNEKNVITRYNVQFRITQGKVDDSSLAPPISMITIKMFFKLHFNTSAFSTSRLNSLFFFDFLFRMFYALNSYKSVN